MKASLRHSFGNTLRRVAKVAEKEVGATFFHNQAIAQKSLMQQYRLLASHGKEWLPAIADVGFRSYSQFEEDGILLYLFSLVPPVNRTVVEICAGSGRECMAANLIINHGWWGYLFDGNEHNVEAARTFFANSKDTFLHPPRFNQAWITAENVNDEIAKAGAKGKIDLFSLDIDGMDYWVWKAMTVIEPQVVVCEINNSIPAEHALTVAYDPKFVFESELFRSASLAAMAKLGKEKGYRLIGMHRFGFNAFFMKRGIGEEFFPEVDVASCLNDPFTREAREKNWPSMSKLAWQSV